MYRRCLPTPGSLECPNAAAACMYPLTCISAGCAVTAADDLPVPPSLPGNQNGLPFLCLAICSGLASVAIIGTIAYQFWVLS